MHIHERHWKQRRQTGEQYRRESPERSRRAAADRRGGEAVRFLVLLVVIFGAAHAAGAHLGPVTTSHTHSGGGSGSVHMGGML